MKKIINKKSFVAIGLLLVLSFSLGYAFHNFISYRGHENPKLKANVYVFKETPQGQDLIYSGNVMTDRIEKKLRNIFGYNNETVYTFNAIALGNSTIAQTKSKLDTEATSTGFARANGTIAGWVNSGDYAFNCTHKFTATGNIAVNSTALHETDTGEATDAVALASLGSLEDFQNNWNCTIIWSITYNAN